MFFEEFGKLFKNTFLTEQLWVAAPCEFEGVLENTFSIEHLWETAHFMYKLQKCN